MHYYDLNMLPTNREYNMLKIGVKNDVVAGYSVLYRMSI